MSLASLVCLALPAHAQAGSASEDAGAAITTPSSAMTLAELERILAPLGDPSQEARRAAARQTTELGEDATAAIQAKLAAYRRDDLDTGGILKTATHGARGESFDLLDALLRMEPNGAAYRLLVGTLALVRGLAHIATFDATREMVLVAGDHDGAFRAEVTRQMKKLGERAIPALIVARKDASPAVRRWSFAMLDGMNRTRPGEQIQTKSNAILADTLRAFAIVKDPDALTIVLSFVSSDRAQVQAAARDALSAYGDDALPKLREAYANLTGKSAPDTWTAPQAAKELFAAYDRLRMQEVYALLDEGIAKQKDGNLSEAIALFDKVLARQPLIERRVELVPFYVQYAQTLEDRDRPAAVAYYRKAQRLDPDNARQGQIASAIAYLEGEDLVARGIADADAFRRALKLDPGNAKARAALDRLESEADARSDRVKRWTLAGALVGAAVLLIVLFGGRKRNGTPMLPPA